jgi:hypothetical protein
MRNDQLAHDSLVLTAYRALAGDGFTNLRADVGGYTPPERIIWCSTNEGHIPDISATKGGVPYLFEVETPDTINTEHTASQLKLFDAHMANNNGQAWMIVPSIAEKQAKNLIGALGLKKTGVWAI